MDKKNTKGFTLIEMVIVFTTILVTLLFATPIVISVLQGSDAESGAKQLISLLIDAQQSAYSRKNRNLTTVIDKCYGISFASLSSRQFVSFFSDYSAGSCGTQMTTYVPEVGHSAASTSLTDVTFVPGSFRPLVSGTITITDNSNIYNVIISDEGAITYKQIQ